jgi:hypothetical protein
MTKTLCVVFMAFLAGGVVNASAETFCVGTPSELTSALASAQSNAANDTIKIIQGTYAGIYGYTSAEPYSLTLEGGYLPGCANKAVDPSNTVLDAASAGSVLLITQTAGSGDIGIDGISFINGAAAQSGNGSGLGIVSAGGKISVTHSRFVANDHPNFSSVSGGGGFGGGLFLGGSPDIQVSDCEFQDNKAYEGGGLYILGSVPNGSAVVKNSTFLRNDTDSVCDNCGTGAGIHMEGKSTAVTFLAEGNVFREHISGDGAGISVDGSHSWLYGSNCTIILRGNEFRDNHSGWEGGGVDISYIAAVTIENNGFFSNFAPYGGGLLGNKGSWAMVNNTFQDNTGWGGAGGTLEDIWSGKIRGNQFTGNTALEEGAGLRLVQFRSDANVEIDGNTFSGNTARYPGGGLYVKGSRADGPWQKVTVSVTNNILSGNRSTSGAGMSLVNVWSSSIGNNTFSGNEADGSFVCSDCVKVGGAGLWLALTDNLSSCDVYNNIFWGNLISNSTTMKGPDAYIANDYTGDGIPAVVRSRYNAGVTGGVYCQLPLTLDEHQILDIDPLFADSLQGDYHLLANSPMIDAGTNDPSPAELTVTDRDGHRRIHDGNGDNSSIVDIGAYEFGSVIHDYVLTVGSSGLYPPTGVVISVDIPDRRGDTGGTTQFDRLYESGTTVTLVAPPTVVSDYFVAWTGCDTTNATSCTVTMNSYRDVVAYYTSLGTVRIKAVDDGFHDLPGVPMVIIPADKSGLGDGTTPFDRVYYKGTVVSVTAPDIFEGKKFDSWANLGVTGRTCSIEVAGYGTVYPVSAIYRTQHTLTVASINPASGVEITVSPVDNLGQGNGATQFTRVYSTYVLVTLTAPASAGGNNFSYWSGCDTATGTACTVEYYNGDSDKTVTAVFGVQNSTTITTSQPPSTTTTTPVTTTVPATTTTIAPITTTVPATTTIGGTTTSTISDNTTSTTTTIGGTTTSTISDNTTSTTTTPAGCIDKDADGYGDNCTAGPDCNDNDSFYNEVCPDCTVKVIPKTLGWFLGESEKTRRLLVIGNSGTVYDENTAVRWESSEIAVLSKRVFFKRFMLIKVSIDGFALAKGDYRALIGTCSGKLTLVK